MMVGVSPDIQLEETKLSTILDAIKNDAILITSLTTIIKTYLNKIQFFQMPIIKILKTFLKSGEIVLNTEMNWP
jgi:hypothetical protein